MKATINITLHFLQLFFICKCHYIQKCCDRKKQLALNFDTCIDFDDNKGIERYETYDVLDKEGIHLVKAGENESHHVWWLPPDIKFVSSKNQHSTFKMVPIPFKELTDIKFLYGTKCPCAVTEREIVPFTDYVFILENGSLLITNVEDNVRPKTTVFPYNSYCLDRVSLTGSNKVGKRSSHILDHSFAILLCPCIYMPCIRVCCKWKHFLNVTKIPETCEYSPNISLKWNLKYKDFATYEEKNKFPEQFNIIQNMPECKHGEYHLNERSSSHLQFWILPDGNINVEGRYFPVKYKDYCIHYWNVNGTFQTNLRICKTPEEDSYRRFERILYGSYFAVGAFFLALTLLIYGVVKDLRTSIHAYYLMAHVFCMFITTLVLAIKEFFRHLFSRNFCIGVAYTIQFSFISATFWLNVMCIDISNTFKRYSSSNRFNLPQNGKKMFMWNSIYVWGTTLAITAVTAIADNTSILDISFRPEFGVQKNCWFLGGVTRSIFFYIPVSTVFLFNLYLFLSTVREIRKLQKDSSTLFNRQESNRHLGSNSMKKDKLRLMLYAKLFGLMGITWIFEILSWAIGGPDYYWFLTDAINSLQGLFIFLIFCCKKKILSMFLNSLLNIPMEVRQNRSQKSNSTTNTDCSCTINKTDSMQLEILSSSNRNSEAESN